MFSYFKSLLSTIRIYCNKNLKNRIINGLNENVNNCINEDEINW